MQNNEKQSKKDLTLCGKIKAGAIFCYYPFNFRSEQDYHHLTTFVIAVQSDFPMACSM